MMHDTVTSPPTLMKRTLCLILFVCASLSLTKNDSLFADATIISSLNIQSEYKRVRKNGWGLASHEIPHTVSDLNNLIVSLRGGSDTESESEEYEEDEESSESDDESDDETDDETDDEDSTEEEYDSDEEYEEEDEDNETAVSTKIETSKLEDQEYDEVLMPSSFQQLGVTLGVTFISNRLDMSDKRVIKFAR